MGKKKGKKNTAPLPFFHVVRVRARIQIPEPYHAWSPAPPDRRRRASTLGGRRGTNCQGGRERVRGGARTAHRHLAKSAVHVAPAGAAPYPVRAGQMTGLPLKSAKRAPRQRGLFSAGPARPHHIGVEVGPSSRSPPSSPSPSPSHFTPLAFSFSPRSPVSTCSVPFSSPRTSPRLSPPTRPRRRPLLDVLAKPPPSPLGSRRRRLFSLPERQQRKLLDLSPSPPGSPAVGWLVPRLGRACAGRIRALRGEAPPRYGERSFWLLSVSSRAVRSLYAWIRIFGAVSCSIWMRSVLLLRSGTECSISSPFA